MRKIKFSDGTEWEVRPLTVGKVKQLRAMADKEAIDQMFATVEAAGYTSEQYDALTMPDFVELNKAIQAETYGLPEETKN